MHLVEHLVVYYDVLKDIFEKNPFQYILLGSPVFRFFSLKTFFENFKKESRQKNINIKIDIKKIFIYNYNNQ